MALPADNRTRVVMALLFFSGAASLGIEVVTIRMLSLVFGNTIYAFSTVISAFLLGLAIGSALSDRLIARYRKLFAAKAIAIYGALEGAVGLYAIFLLPLLLSQQQAFIGFEQALSAGVGRLLAHVIIATLALIVPTILMGMTLPVLTLVLPERSRVASLYGVNTLGAATGAFLTTFVLVRGLGCSTSLGVLGGVGLAIFVCGFAFQRFLTARRDPASETPDPASGQAGEGSEASLGLILFLSFASGLVFVVGEIVWTRVLSQALGNRIYVSSLSLSIILLAIGLGAMIARRAIQRFRPLPIIGACYAVAALFFGLGLLLKPGALRALAINGFVVDGGMLLKLIPFFLALCIVPAVVMAVAFPLALSMRPRGAAFVSQHIGSIYALNTVGCVLGSLGTGYLLLALIGLNGSAALLAVSLAAVAGPLLWRVTTSPRRRAGLALGLVLVAGLSGLQAFRSQAYFPLEMVEVVEEDEYGLFQVIHWKAGQKRTFVNTTELVFNFGDFHTRQVQEMQAHLAMVFAPEAREVLNLCTGFGITAGAFTLYDAPESIETVEILPLMIKHAGLFRKGNYAFWEDPRTRVVIADGRHHLVASDKRYDVISINVTDPYLPGVAAMFSADFYEIVKQRLAPRGLVLQHVFGPDVGSLVHQIRQTFPHLRAAKSYHNGYNLIASVDPLPYDRTSVNAFYEAHRDKLAPLAVASGDALFDALQAGDAAIEILLATPPAFIETDDHPVLEFRLGNGLGLLRSNQ